MITQDRLASATALLARYSAVRARTEALAAPLSPEDCTVQSMPDVSPTRWHLAHTTWFFETFVLERLPGYEGFHPSYRTLFNSYYNTVGEQFPRAQRGLITRPSLSEVFEYRRAIDERVREFLERLDGEHDDATLSALELGLNHEEQHQELILTDIKHVLSCNPQYPAYLPKKTAPSNKRAPALQWRAFEGGVSWIGNGEEGFAFDNERPRHRVFLEDFELGARLVTNAEYLEFVQDGGYRRPELWLSDGWRIVNERGWKAPLYWVEREETWLEFKLAGLRPLDPVEPVVHVSYYEAEAYARWALARLPTEAEWETAAAQCGPSRAGERAPEEAGVGNLHPSAPTGDGLAQLFDEAWQWTSSAYAAYPGYAPLTGALGEYNGKFMCNQHVLRGSSCATPRSHARITYRNFFPPDARWQFSGLRLAR